MAAKTTIGLLEKHVLYAMRHTPKPRNDRPNLLAVMSIAPSSLDYALGRLVDQGFLKRYEEGEGHYYVLTPQGWDVEREDRR